MEGFPARPDAWPEYIPEQEKVNPLQYLVVSFVQHGSFPGTAGNRPPLQQKQIC